MKIIAKIFLVTTLSSCATQFTKPICETQEFHFPSRYFGTYKFTVPVLDPASGGLPYFHETILEIDYSGAKIMSTAPAFAQIQKHLPVPLKNDDDIPLRDYHTGFCTWDGETYYSQVRNDNGTYQLSRVHFSDMAISLVEIGFNKKDLVEANIPYRIIHNELPIPDSGSISLGDKQLVVLNRDISREKLLKLANDTGFGIVWSRIKKAPEGHRQGQKVWNIRF